MKQFLFFLEFDGKRTVPNPYEESITIRAPHINAATKELANKENLKSVSIDYIKPGEYRVFFVKKRMLKKDLEIIFYIKTP